MAAEPTQPSDKVRLVVTDSATGDYFRLGTRTVPDKLIFKRSPSISNAHELVMTLAEFEKMQEDFGFRPAASDSFIQIHLLVNEAAHGGGEMIAALQADLDAAKKRHDDTVADLGKALDEARGQKPDGPVGLTDDEKGMLGERDALITLLMPYVEGESDTPAGVLTRLLATLREKGVEGNPEVLDEGGGVPPSAADVSIAIAAAAGLPIPTSTFDPAAYKASLPTDLGELRGVAAPLGVPNFASMNAPQLRNAITRAAVARHTPVAA